MREAVGGGGGWGFRRAISSTVATRLLDRSEGSVGPDETSGKPETTAIDGLSIALTGTNVGNPTRIGFSDPSSNIVTAMTDFVAALNEIQSSLGTMMNAQTGDLATDPGAQMLRRALSAITSKVLMPNAATGDPATLAELGVKTNRDGTYTLDTAMLNAVVAKNPQGVAAMFTPGLYGVFAVGANADGAVARPFQLAGQIRRDHRFVFNDENVRLRH